MSKSRDKIISALQSGYIGSLTELSVNVGVSIATVKKYLGDLFSERPDLLKSVSGYVPKAEVLVDLVEQKHGLVSSRNLMDTNLATKLIVDEIAKPELEKFLLEALTPHLEGDYVNVRTTTLLDFIADDLIPYINETGNGSVSIVGRLNEEIVLRSLRNSPNLTPSDFQRTGQNSDADIIISQRDGTKKNLYVEVKSYHARERLLRGLQDIGHPEKVGIGFFRDASEFNPSRTQTLISSHAWAIYLPPDTYKNVPSEALSMTTSQQNLFYRPTDLFVEDMEYFCAHGTLTKFR